VGAVAKFVYNNEGNERRISMAKKKNSRAKQTKKAQEQKNQLMFTLTGLAFILLGIFASFKLGFLGRLIANVFRFLVGNTYLVFSIMMVLYGLILVFLRKEPRLKNRKHFLGGIFIYTGVLIFLHAWLFRNIMTKDTHVLSLTWQKLLTDIRANVIDANVGGGMIGALLYNLTHFLVDQVGTYVIVFFLILVGTFFAGDFHWSNVVEKLQLWMKGISENLSQKKADNLEKKRIQALKQELQPEKVEEERPSPMLDVKETKTNPTEVSPIEIDSYQKQYQQDTQVKQQDLASIEDEEELKDFTMQIETENPDYLLPTSSLLNDIPVVDQSEEYATIEKKIGVLEKTFQSFGVDAKVVRASLGPAVTKYEIQPAVGVKVSKIVSLSDDLALALAAKDIRMEAPIPGKSVIGIEVPNSQVSTVSFRDVIESQAPNTKVLEVPLGRDISGTVISADLAKMPHLLIAGSTGSGKSVCINGIITSLLMRAKPHEVKLMMIDPKMVELNVYNGIPHLLTPVVTNPRKAAQALHKVVEEMEKRYELFAANGVRNMQGYNEMIQEFNEETGEAKPILPFIVVIVDELADLMMVASNEVEDAIIRLAQMARAAGIHMILATQRPSVDVITGIIKANVPSRIAFAVSSGTDSRTIIDSNGAEKLLGRGDMLFLPMGENKPVRVQGAFISDHEVEHIVNFVKDQQEANYQEDMIPTDEPTASHGEPQDELYDEAVALVVDMETASISMLQRKFRIGYNRAARLIDEMEAHHIVGPSEGSKPRKVLLEASKLTNELE